MTRRLVTIGIATLLLAACGQGDGNDQVTTAEAESNASVAPGEPAQDLAALVAANPRLMQLIKAAGMERVLAGKEPYTLLVPSADALDKLPAGTFDNLDQPAKKAELTALLRAHILPGTILTADLARAVESGDGKATVATMTGQPLTITRDGEGFRVSAAGGQTARITGTEQPARNGVVHQIDTVLTPPPEAFGSPARLNSPKAPPWVKKSAFQPSSTVPPARYNVPEQAAARTIGLVTGALRPARGKRI